MLGAEVLKVEPPHGDKLRRWGPFPGAVEDPEKSGYFSYLNAGKQSVTLDLTQPGDRVLLDSLLFRSDVLVHDVLPVDRAAYGLESRALCERLAQLIVTTISPFGDSGPRAHYRAYELNAFHASGMASLTPLGSPYPDLPPLKIYGNQAELMAGLHGSLVTLAAYWHRLGGGAGQAVDVSEQECLAAMLEMSLVYWTYNQTVTSRLNASYSTIIDCADGKMLVTMLTEQHWQRIVQLMGDPQWAHQETFSRSRRSQNGDELMRLMSEWSREYHVSELEQLIQDQRIPSAPLNRVADVCSDPHLRERGFFVPLPIGRDGVMVRAPGIPFKTNVALPVTPVQAPRIGEHNSIVFAAGCPAKEPGVAPTATATSARPPLSGVRVLDFTWIWAGPYCTLQLAHLGAEVIRIETAQRPCVNRLLPPFFEGKPGLNRGGGFHQWNQGKRSLQLDLTNPKALEIIRRLVPLCDIVTENFAAGVIDRMGLGYQTLRQLKPGLIMLSLTGYGQTGPYRNHVNLGQQTAARGGMFWLTGYPDDAPRQIGVSYADPLAGMISSYALVAALIHRKRTGEGQYIDVSMFETLEVMLAGALLEYAITGREPERAGNRDPFLAPNECYKARGDAEKWVTITVANEEQWRALCAAMGQTSLADDSRFRTAELRKRNEPELNQLIGNWTPSLDRWEATQILQRAGVAAFPTLNNEDVGTDPHLWARGFLLQRDHPVVGRQTHAGIPWTMSGTPCYVRAAAPLLGADTDDVLISMLGYSIEEVKQFREEGVIN
jgi:crotonobetainyl-CoA:carnitine CoA-transferase CaiB-like acyl-CoA transferase